MKLERKYNIIDVSNLPNGDYMISANFTNITEGSISWCNMMIESGSEVTEYEPYVDFTPKVPKKNMLIYPYNETTKTQFGITFTDNGDGTITANGTATDRVIFYCNQHTKNGIYLENGVDYTFSGAPSGSSYNTYWLEATNGKVWLADLGSGKTVTGTDELYGFYIIIKAGVTLNNAIFKLQLERGTVVTEYEPYQLVSDVNVETTDSNSEKYTYYANIDGSVSDVISISPSMTLLVNNPYVTIECEYNLSNALGDEFGNNDALSDMVKVAEKTIETLTAGLGVVSAEVQKNTELMNKSADGLDNRVKILEQSASVAMTSDKVKIEIETTLSEQGASKLATKTGYVFDDEGIEVHKTDSEMSTKITDNGMTVSKNDSPVLTANNKGVDAVNLHASTYLTVGGRIRFEKYGTDRIGCFWI